MLLASKAIGEANVIPTIFQVAKAGASAGMARGDGRGRATDYCVSLVCRRRRLACRFGARLAGRLRADSTAGMALGFPAIARRRTHSRRRPLSDVDRSRMVRHPRPSTGGRESRRAGDSAAGPGPGAAEIELTPQESIFVLSPDQIDVGYFTYLLHMFT